jgi:bacterioferritin-associated ferredoxin
VFACICMAVTCEEVDAAIDEGADTVEAVGEVTAAGTGCGTCQDRIECMISQRGPLSRLAALRVA